jgi:hypothetical protein
MNFGSRYMPLSLLMTAIKVSTSVAQMSTLLSSHISGPPDTHPAFQQAALSLKILSSLNEHLGTCHMHSPDDFVLQWVYIAYLDEANSLRLVKMLCPGYCQSFMYCEAEREKMNPLVLDNHALGRKLRQKLTRVE